MFNPEDQILLDLNLHRVSHGGILMIAYLFPGQGSQARGMGRGLFDEVSEFKSIEHEVDKCLGYSIRQLCLEETGNRLKETQYTQPSLYVVNALHYYKALSQGEKPDVVAGHSVGEYNALLAANVFDFLTGLRLVQKRGELMANAKNGGMAAVVGLSSGTVRQLVKENGLETLDVANFNSPVQTVLSGPTNDISRAGAVFEKAGARLYMPLMVSAAFHSRYMREAADEFAAFLSPFTFETPRIPVISNVTGDSYPTGDPTATIKALLVQQITHPVLWTQSIRNMLSRGVTYFKEIGPGTVLTKLVQQIQQEVGATIGAAR
jgi:malonyl CoA-acyl carrier protein transacylase